MARDREVTFYSDEQTLRELDELANERDTTRSTLVFELVREGLRREREGAVSAETRAAERLQDLLDDGLTDMEDVARQMQDLNAKAGVYSVAVFELVKQTHGEAAIRKALRTGARRLREDDIDELAGGTDETGASTEADDAATEATAGAVDDGDEAAESTAETADEADDSAADNGRTDGALDFEALREGSR